MRNPDLVIAAYQAGVADAQLGDLPYLFTDADLAERYGADYVTDYWRGVGDVHALNNILGR